MADSPFLGELKVVSFNFAPAGWAMCNGSLLPINQNQALFSLLGTMYGGDGQVNFALPDLRGRIPMHTSQGFTQGQRAGEAAHTLSIAELPQHVHFVQSTQVAGTTVLAGGNVLANANLNLYAPANPPLVAIFPGTVATAGGSQPHNNMSPYLVLNVVIALQGVFPSQN